MASAESEVKEVFTSEISEVTDGGVEDDDFALTEAHIAAIRTIFKEFDKDGSGLLTLASSPTCALRLATRSPSASS